MTHLAKPLSSRSLTAIRRVGSRLDRRMRWTSILSVLTVLLTAPFWSAAVHLVSPAAPARDSLHVPILVYHSIAPAAPEWSARRRQLDVDTAAFRQQMTYLAANRYNVIPLATLMNALDGHGTVPPRAVVITFDDGWRSQYDNALPILQQLHLPATFFLISGQVGVGSLYMDLEQVRVLQRAGMTLGSHSRTHKDLTRVTDAQLRDEVLGSRQDLQKNLGVQADVFAYPYGMWNGRVAAAVRAAGYRGARAFPGGSWNDGTRLYALHSVLVTDDMNAFARALGVVVITSRDSPQRLAVRRR